ncbi:MAG TPA: hypothetical protein VD978_00270 [Azospirillum sp.]|nr:hypothetical protein [Azospirillum sp.]
MSGREHSPVTVLRYPTASLTADYARAAAGLAMTVLPLLLLDVSAWVGVPLAAAGVLFAAFAARTAQRHATRVIVDEDGVRTQGPFGSSVRWDALTGLRLRYYAVRRDRADGWLVLTLEGGGRIRVESTLDGFDALAEQAAKAARRNAVPLDRATEDNLLALGIDV